MPGVRSFLALVRELTASGALTPDAVDRIAEAETPAPPSAPPAKSEHIALTMNESGVVVAVNGNPRVRVDASGAPILHEGYRVRIDDVLVDDQGRPLPSREPASGPRTSGAGVAGWVH